MGGGTSSAMAPSSSSAASQHHAEDEESSVSPPPSSSLATTSSSRERSEILVTPEIDMVAIPDRPPRIHHGYDGIDTSMGEGTTPVQQDAVDAQLPVNVASGLNDGQRQSLFSSRLIFPLMPTPPSAELPPREGQQTTTSFSAWGSLAALANDPDEDEHEGRNGDVLASHLQPPNPFPRMSPLINIALTRASPSSSSSLEREIARSAAASSSPNRIRLQPRFSSDLTGSALSATFATAPAAPFAAAAAASQEQQGNHSIGGGRFSFGDMPDCDCSDCRRRQDRGRSRQGSNGGTWDSGESSANLASAPTAMLSFHLEEEEEEQRSGPPRGGAAAATAAGSGSVVHGSHSSFHSLSPPPLIGGRSNTGDVGGGGRTSPLPLQHLHENDGEHGGEEPLSPRRPPLQQAGELFGRAERNNEVPTAAPSRQDINVPSSELTRPVPMPMLRCVSDAGPATRALENALDADHDNKDETNELRNEAVVGQGVDLTRPVPVLHRPHVGPAMMALESLDASIDRNEPHIPQGQDGSSDQPFFTGEGGLDRTPPRPFFGPFGPDMVDRTPPRFYGPFWPSSRGASSAFTAAPPAPTAPTTPPPTAATPSPQPRESCLDHARNDDPEPAVSTLLPAFAPLDLDRSVNDEQDHAANTERHNPPTSTTHPKRVGARVDDRRDDDGQEYDWGHYDSGTDWGIGSNGDGGDAELSQHIGRLVLTPQDQLLSVLMNLSEDQEDSDHDDDDDGDKKGDGGGETVSPLSMFSRGQQQQQQRQGEKDGPQQQQRRRRTSFRPFRVTTEGHNSATPHQIGGHGRRATTSAVMEHSKRRLVSRILTLRRCMSTPTLFRRWTRGGCAGAAAHQAYHSSSCRSVASSSSSLQGGGGRRSPNSGSGKD